MQVIKTLTLTEFLRRLRELGIKIEQEKLKRVIAQGVFKGVVYEVKGARDEYFILEKDFNRWVAAYAEEEEPAADVMAYEAMNK